VSDDPSSKALRSPALILLFSGWGGGGEEEIVVEICALPFCCGDLPLVSSKTSGLVTWIAGKTITVLLGPLTAEFTTAVAAVETGS
jgi:hypothetical protein